MAREHHNQASPVQIAKALGGIDFPKQKDEIVQYAKSHNPEDNPDVIEALERIPDGEYGSMADVTKGVGKVE